MVNENLNQLKKVFDRIESYDITQNIGFRSLKNIGVWLCIYALTDEHDKMTVIHELAEKAGMGQYDEMVSIKKLADQLIEPKILTNVIEGYEKASGSFTLTVNSQINHQKLLNKITERDYQHLLLKHVQLDLKQEADLVFLMDNTIKFNWSSANYWGLTSGQYAKVKDTFCGNKTDYLMANSEDHLIQYGVIKHNKCLFHVACLGTLQKDGDQTANCTNAYRTNTYLIESVDGNDAVFLQKNYFDIINQVKNQHFNHENTYKLLKNSKQASAHVKIDGKLGKRNEFHFTVSFPQILDTMKTTEERLGIYEHFVGKNIANLPIKRMKYRGTRELAYDDKGGEIKNREEIYIREMVCISKPNIINIQYTTANPFMMVYEAANGADYYPYFIADPRKDLTMSFSANQVYPNQQQAKGFASQGRSLFSSSVPNTATENDRVLGKYKYGMNIT